MCNDPNHDPTPVAQVVRENPGLNSTDLYARLYREHDVTNQGARIALAVAEGLVIRKRRGKAMIHYPAEG